MYILASDLDAIDVFVDRVKLAWNVLCLTFKEVSFYHTTKVEFQHV